VARRIGRGSAGRELELLLALETVRVVDEKSADQIFFPETESFGEADALEEFVSVDCGSKLPQSRLK
jgi:hypothetical protein